MINLSRIKRLGDEVHYMYLVAETNALSAAEPPIDTEVFVRSMRIRFQYQCLWENLNRLKTISEDFAAGRFEKYMREHAEFDSDLPWEPIDEYHDLISPASVRSLPARISQYADLKEFADLYSTIRKKREHAFKQVFGELRMHYLTTDEEGQAVAVPQDRIPPDELRRMEATWEIKAIEVEYCLDGYDTLMDVLNGLLNGARPSDDIAPVAQTILRQFSTAP